MNGGVEPKSLRVGMKLHLPAGARTAADVSKKSADVVKKQGADKRESAARPSSADVAPAQPASTKTYVVRSGDSLRQIAEARLGDGRRWQEIAKLNPGVDPKRLRVGQSLKLPAESTRSLVAQAAVPSSTSNSEKPRVR
jgi:nucleoid-associated protein YgaU